MSADKIQTKTKHLWIIALLVSVAINGMLAGLLFKRAQLIPDGTHLPPAQISMQSTPSNPRHFLNSLSPERRKQVMTTAMKSLKAEGGEHPRKIFKQLRRAKHKTMSLVRAETVDTKAVEQSLAEHPRPQPN